MKTPLYRKAIHHGWRLAFRDKWLWIFGLFAAFLGQLGVVDFLSKAGFATSDVGTYLADVGILGNNTAAAPPVASFDMRMMIIWLFVVIAVVGIGLVFASVVSQGALIHATAQSLRKKKEIHLGQAWHAGVSHFWRLFGINLVKKGLIVLLAIVVSASAFRAVDEITVETSLLFLLTFVVASFVGLTLSFLAIYAAGYVVVEEYPLPQALASAWRLFADHWLVSIEVGLIVLLFNIFLALAVVIGFVVFFFPAMLVWFAAIVVGSQLLLSGGFILALVLFTAYLMILGAFFTVFTTSVWTYLFMSMHKTGIKSRVVHWLSYTANVS